MFTANAATDSFTNTNITSVKKLIIGEKITGLLQFTIRAGLQTVLVLTGLIVE